MFGPPRWMSANAYNVAYGLRLRDQDWVGNHDALRDSVLHAAQCMSADDLREFDTTFDHGELWAELANQNPITDAEVTHRGAVRIAQQIHDAAGRLTAEKPKLEREMRFRLQPLQDQWRIRGAGLTDRLNKLLQSAWRAPPGSLTTPHMIGVIPLLGGRPRAASWLPHAKLTPTRLGVNSQAGLVRFEALLTNVDDRLPEFTRIAWLVTQLALARYSENVIPSRKVPELAMLITFALADDLEWFPIQPELIDLACELWLPLSNEEHTLIASRLTNTWERIESQDRGLLSPTTLLAETDCATDLDDDSMT